MSTLPPTPRRRRIAGERRVAGPAEAAVEPEPQPEPEPAPKPKPSCLTISDPKGDTFAIRAQDGQGANGPQEDALDIVSGDLASDGNQLNRIPFDAVGRYGDQLSWRLVLIGLTDDAGQYVARGYTPLRKADNYSVDVGGAYSLTRNIALTGGVRYRIDHERLSALKDDRRDSQAVYVGTAFKF